MKQLFFTVIATLLCNYSYADSIKHKTKFDGKYLISISDADMVASAYVDGQLGPKEGSDKLSIIDLNQSIANSRPIEVPASNSVAGPPAALAIDTQGHYAYIIETFGPRPNHNQKHTFSDLSPGNLLTVYNINDIGKPKLITKQNIGQRPDSIDISPDGNWLLITYYPDPNNAEYHPIGLYKVREGIIQNAYFPNIPNWNRLHRLIFSAWHPDGKHIALINETTADVSFFSVDFKNKSLSQWGNKVSVGKAPFIGRFTKDGQHFLVNNLFWGIDVEGKWNEAPNGTIANISLNIDQNTRHALSSQVMVGPSPEGFNISENGNWVVAANMERSWLPYDDPRQSWYSSLTLIQRNPKTGAMHTVHTLPYEGILPESLVFDNSGQSLAVATFDHYDKKHLGGSIDFFKIVSDPLNSNRTMLMQTRWYIPVTRGVHDLKLIR